MTPWNFVNTNTMSAVDLQLQNEAPSYPDTVWVSLDMMGLFLMMSLVSYYFEFYYATLGYRVRYRNVNFVLTTLCQV